MGTTGGIKQMGTHNISKYGDNAWVALCVHPPTLILIPIYSEINNIYLGVDIPASLNLCLNLLMFTG
jgi:hypothetical protein